MSEDLARRLQHMLAALHDGDITDDEFARFIARMRAQFGDAIVDSVLQATTADAPSSVTTQHISGGTVAAAVGGSVYGNIYINGRWTPDQATVIRRYLSWWMTRCEMLPLKGIREQISSRDVLPIKLEHVYTQLATNDEVERERFERETITTVDVEQLIHEHIGERVVPAQQWTSATVLSAHPNVLHVGLGEPSAVRYLIDKLQSIEPDVIHDRVIAALSAFDEYLATTRTLTIYGPQLVTESIAEHSRLVLLGEPGSGKSTVLRYLTLTLAAAGLDPQIALQERLQGWQALDERQRLLPVFFPLLSFAKWLGKQHPTATGTVHDLWNAITDYLDPAHSSSGLASMIHERLQEGDVLLLLDGLDEVATVDSRRKVVRAVQQFGDEFPQCRIVVTCRVRAYEGEQNRDWHLPGWPTATLADWTLGQMDAFVAAWYREAASTMDEARRNDRIAALKHAIMTRDELRRLGIRPLLLTVMALVHLNDGRLPEDMPSLLSRCIDILLAQWELGRNDGSEYGTLMDYMGLPELTVQSLRPLLEQAAFIAHEATTPGSQGFLSKADLFQLVGKELERLEHPNPWAGTERFLDYTDKRAGLLHANDAGDAYAFPLQTFQEYLAGRKLVSGVDPVPGILQRRVDDRWYRPIALGIGDQVTSKSLAVPYQLFQKLIRLKGRTPERAQRDFLLAADLGGEVGWDRLVQGDELFEGVRQELAEKLASVVEGKVLPATERVRAGVYLATLGDPRLGVCMLPPAMVELQGGSFVIGVTWAGFAALPDNEQPYFRYAVNEQPVTVATFAIGRYPVTNAQFKMFMDDDGYNPDAPWWDDAGRTWLTEQRDRRVPDFWTDTSLGITQSNHSVVGVAWYEAQAFCRWLTQHRTYNLAGYTYRLPSEAEWEWAARSVGRQHYPWGDAEPDGERANYDGMYSGPTPVGCFPAGQTAEGVLDLAGNVWEWTSSIYAPYPYDPDDGREQLTAVSQQRFTLRGGAWNTASINLRVAHRYFFTLNNWSDSFGFRLAKLSV